MKLALVKLLIAFLASLGVYLPSQRLYVCQPGHTPRNAPQSCEVVRIPVW